MQQVSSVHCRMRNVARDTFWGMLRLAGRAAVLMRGTRRVVGYCDWAQAV